MRLNGEEEQENQQNQFVPPKDLRLHLYGPSNSCNPFYNAQPHRECLALLPSQQLAQPQ